MNANERGITTCALKRLFAMLGRVRLGIAGNGRLTPEIAPGDLWRMLPAIIRDLVTVAETVTPGEFDHYELEFLRDLAITIERGHTAGKGGAK